MVRRELCATFLSIVTLVATLGASRIANAEVRVERADGADSCPDAASFANRMREGGAEPTTITREIAVHFEHVASGFRSSVRMANGTQRSLADDAPTCDGLAEATVLAVKLALDLEDAPAIAPVVAPAPVSRPEPRAVAPVASAAERVAPFAEISASGVVAFGIGSPVAPGMRAGAALVLGHDRWSLGITGLALPAQTHDVGDGTVEVSVLGGGIEGCGRTSVARALQLALCGRVEGWSLEGVAHGFKRTEDHARPLFTGTVLGRARARVAGPVAVFIEAGAVLPFVRERFVIDAVGVVYDPPVVAAATGIGVVVDFE